MNFVPPVLPPFPLRAARLVEGVHLGSHKSRRRGRGVEFAEFRAYRQGDQIRDIDWRVYGRTDRLFIRLREEELLRRVCVLFDDSPSMVFGSPESKFDRARLATASVAMLCDRTGDSAGVESVSGSVRIPARHGAGHRAEILRRLGECPAAAVGGEGDLASAIERITVRRRRGMLLVVLSDFLTSLDDLRRALRLWRAGGGDLIALHFLAREEADLGTATAMRYRDPESGSEIDVFVPEIRDSYMEALNAHLKSVETMMASFGFDHALVRGEEDLRTCLLKVIRQRSARRSTS